MSKIKIVIDTNILIDLCVGDLIDAFMNLPFSFVLSDVIREEFSSPVNCVKKVRKIKTSSLGPDKVQEVYELFHSAPNLSLNDCFALLLAKEKKAILLTGDKKLRKIAEQKGMEVHGILWVMDMLFEEKILDGERLIEALRAMLRNDTRLPPKEYKERVKKMEEGIENFSSIKITGFGLSFLEYIENIEKGKEIEI